VTNVEAWSNAWKNHSEALIHPFDETVLRTKAALLGRTRCKQRLIYTDAIPSNAGDLKAATGQFRLELGAMPFVGNIQQASIFLMMINPGVSWNDYVDRNNILTATLFAQNKRQEVSTCLALEPNAAQGWSSYYLRTIFGSVLRAYKGSEYERARTFLSANLAILELVPYFSQNVALIDQLNLDQELETAKLARSAAQELAKNPNNLMITRWKRGEERWGVQGTVRSTCRQGLGKAATTAIQSRINKHLLL
jgi:hypothetical protein